MSLARSRPGPVFDHLDRLTDELGVFEHARHSDPRPEHGYCVDDAARGLVVVLREQEPTQQLRRLAGCYLDVTVAAVDPDGLCHNRRAQNGTWTDMAGLGDWWGRAVWGLGVASVRAHTAGMRARALLAFRTATRQRTPHLHGAAFAALGAAALLRERPDEAAATALLRHTIPLLSRPAANSGWPWPEPRLRYGSGALPEALIAAGWLLPDDDATARGLHLLTFLLDRETRDGHLSVTPVGGRGRTDDGPGFDQQPIEVAALADACALAYDLTGESRWRDAVRMAWAWFEGDNDSRTPMYDPLTGAGFDGLQRSGHNLNQGAESTLAMLSTAQQARRLDVAT